MENKLLTRFSKSELEDVANKFSEAYYDHQKVGEALAKAGISAGSADFYNIYTAVGKKLKELIISEYNSAHKAKKVIKGFVHPATENLQ